MLLGDYIKSLQYKTREACVHDCATVPADWIVTLGLGDPMRDVRGLYRTEQGGLDLIEERGGLVAMFNDGLNDLGIYKTDAPTEGDVGVISIAGQEAGSIFTGKRWLFVGNRGIGFATINPEHIKAAWAVPYG